MRHLAEREVIDLLAECHRAREAEQRSVQPADTVHAAQQVKPPLRYVLMFRNVVIHFSEMNKEGEFMCSDLADGTLIK